MAEEKRFENNVKKFLENDGAWFIKYWAGSKYTKEGIPDIICCHKGRFIAIEVKATNGKPSLLQLVTLRDIRKAGGIGILLYPKDFDYFMAFLEGTEMGNYWYRENKQEQQKWFDKLNA